MLVGLQNNGLEMFKFSSTNIEPALNSVSNRIELKRAVQINQILAIDPRVSDNN